MEFDFLTDISFGVGAVAVGCAPAQRLPSAAGEHLRAWLDLEHNAGMAYMANHFDLRLDPQLLLEGARTVISLAFPYSPRQLREKSLPQLASYAYGVDYHDAIRTRLTEAVNLLKERFGGDYRICIDSAPVMERFWAVRTGIGERCDNGLINVPGYGTRIFLAEILTTIPFADLTAESTVADANAIQPRFARIKHPGIITNEKKSVKILNCLHCGACLKACPAGALQRDSSVDARRCLSYLTIEHRGEWSEEGYQTMHTPAGRHTLYGCDICQNVCPLNAPLNPLIPPTEIPEFQPTEKILSLSAEEAASMTQPEFSAIFKGSAIKRTKLAGLQRNALNTLQP